MNPDDSRSLKYKGEEYKIHMTDKRYQELLRLEDSASLIAFVQRHRLDVKPTFRGSGYEGNPLKKVWVVRKERKLPAYSGQFYNHWELEYVEQGKTWTAAVRKAKRVIEKGKR